MRRAQDRGMERARPHREVVDVAAAPGEEAQILDALDRLAEPRSRFRLIVRGHFLFLRPLQCYISPP
jgi:hypothetical protein